jgi:hypothetical protein
MQTLGGTLVIMEDFPGVRKSVSLAEALRVGREANCS